jgi:hypothetical protein
MVQIMGNGFLFLLVMVAAIVTAAEGEIKRNNHNKQMQSGAPLNVLEFLNNRRWQGIHGLLSSAIKRHVAGYYLLSAKGLYPEIIIPSFSSLIIYIELVSDTPFTI